MTSSWLYTQLLIGININILECKCCNYRWGMVPRLCININILECKSSNEDATLVKVTGININILECKYQCEVWI